LCSLLLASATAVAQPADPPGNSGNAPGITGENPGHSEAGPGDSSMAPGQTGTAPGHDEAGPGHSENAPVVVEDETSAETDVVADDADVVDEEIVDEEEEVRGNSAAAHACQQDGYQDLTSEDGETEFANTGECVSYAAQGGEFGELVGDELQETAEVD
jgi:hypothetical protein